MRNCCKVEGCLDKWVAKGYCSRHYNAVRYRGIPYIRKDIPVYVFLDEGYIENELGCWEWTGSRDKDGYGYLNGKRIPRLAWERYVGAIPFGLCVLHKCDNPPCYNPDHLFLGTHEDNMKDKSKKGRVRNQWT